jgi:hypothetical protein
MSSHNIPINHNHSHDHSNHSHESNNRRGTHNHNHNQSGSHNHGAGQPQRVRKEMSAEEVKQMVTKTRRMEKIFVFTYIFANASLHTFGYFLFIRDIHTFT